MNNYNIKYFFLLLTIPVYVSGAYIKVIPGASPVKIPATTVLNYTDFVNYGPYNKSGETYANITGFVYGSQTFNRSISCNIMTPWKCIDGYCGIPVNSSNPDIIYIPSGSVFAQFRSSLSGPIVNGTVNFNTNSPTFNKAERYSSYACFPQSPYGQSFYVNSGIGNTTNFRANLDWYVYTPASTPVKKISVGLINITGVFGFTDTAKVAIPANDIEVMAEMKCSVSSPSSVDFGTINQKEITGDLLAFEKGDLTISCTSADANSKRDVKISFTGNTEANGKLLYLKDSMNNALAYIRGRLAAPFGGTCGTYSTDDVIFNGSVSLTKSNVGVGLTQIPLTWSLCRNKLMATPTGEGSAQATVTIDWD